MTAINFDQLEPGITGINTPDGYEGMNWDHNFWVANGPSVPGGFANGTHSGPNVAYTFKANPAGFASAGADFDFRKGYFTAAWNNGLKVKVTGYDDGNHVATKTFTVDCAGPTLVKFGHNFDSIDTILIASSGGMDANPADTGSGEHLIMDDFSVKFEGTGAQDWVLAG